MSELNDLIEQYDEGTGTNGKASLFDNTGEPQQAPQEQEQQQMLSSEDVEHAARNYGNKAVNEAVMPTLSSMAERDAQARRENQVDVDPELIFEGNLEKAGKSLVAGLGVVVNDVGNMIDYASMTILPDEVRRSDTFKSVVERLPSAHKLGDALQDWGKVHKSPGLDEFTLDDLFKVEFWATDVAKTIPYMASMLIPGTAGVKGATRAMTWAAKGAAKRGAFGSAKKLMKTRAGIQKGMSTAKAGKDVALGGEGLMGAIATTTAEGEVALSSLGSGLASFLGSGTATTAVIGAGLAGDVYNRALDLGMTEEEAQEAAHGTFVDNSKWFALNGMSWMINFGGLSGKAFKQFNKMRGGAGSAQQVQRTFAQRVAKHAMKGVATGTVEGTEEMFQETYEEWIGEKNLAEARGEEFMDYSDFFTSKNNRHTLGVSFAAGFLMGGRAGLMNSIAENGRQISNKRISIDEDINSYENMNEVQKKARSLQIIEAAVREDNVHELNGFLDKMVKAGKISAEERAEYDNIVMEYAEIASKLPFKEKLTEAGQQALFNIKVKENQLNKALQNFDTLKEKQIQEANANLEGDALASELESIESAYAKNVENTNRSIQEGKDSIAKLIKAKKYSSQNKKVDLDRKKEIESFIESSEYQNLNETEKQELHQEHANLKSRIEEDSYAIEEAAQAAEELMTQEEYEQFTVEGQTDKANREDQEAKGKVGKVVDTIEKAAESVKGAASKGSLDSIKETISKSKNKVKEYFKAKSDLKSKGVNLSEALKGSDNKDSDSKDESFISKLKSIPNRAKAFADKFMGGTEGKEFRKSMRKFDSDIKKMSEEGKSIEEIADHIYNNLSREEQDKFLSDAEGISLLDGYISAAVGLKEESEAHEDAEIVEDEDKSEDSSREDEDKSESEAESEETQQSTETSSEEVKDEEYSRKDAVEADKKGEPDFKEKINSFIESITDKFKGKTKKPVDGRTKYGKVLKNIMKNGFGEVPTHSKKSKDQLSELSALQYYATMNPALENSIISAASKKFPTKQLLLLREVIDEHGVEVAGMALGSSVQVSTKSNVGVTLMHEYGHVYYAMMKDNPSFIRGVEKIIGTEVWDRTKDKYPEYILFDSPMGQVNGEALIEASIVNYESLPEGLKDVVGAYSKAITVGDFEAAESLAKKILNKYVEEKLISPVPESQMHDLIEEAFVESLGPKVFGQLDLMFDKPVEAKQYKSFLRRVASRVSKWITPKDAKEILKGVNIKFENMTLDEIYESIADDFASGDLGKSVKNGRAKYSRAGKLKPEIGAIVSIQMKKYSQNAWETKSVDEISREIAKAIKDAGYTGDLKIKEEIEWRVAKQKEAATGFGLNFDSQSKGVSSIYKAAGYKATKAVESDEILDEDIIDENGDVNITHDDSARVKALDNSTSEFIRAIMMVANPKGKGKKFKKDVLESALLRMSKVTKDNLGKFIKEFNKSTDEHVSEARRIMKEHMSPSEVQSALGSIHNNYRNKYIETLLQTTVRGDGSIIESVALASQERNNAKKIMRAANNIFYKGGGANSTEVGKDVLSRIKSARSKISQGGSLSFEESIRIIAPILGFADKSQYLELAALSEVRIPTNNKIQTITEFTQDWITSAVSDKNVNEKNPKIPVKALEKLVKEMIVASRTKHAIKSVTDVNGNTTLAMNMNNHLLNSADLILEQASTSAGRKALAEKYLNKDGSGNPFIKMAIALGERGMADQAFKIAYDGGVVSFTGRDSKAVSYNDKTKDDILQFDLEQFSGKHDGGKPEGSRTYYTQPISIFANSKRRYSIASVMYTTEAQKASAIKDLMDNNHHTENYMDGASALGFKINEDGSYDLSEQNESMKAWLKNNPGLIKGNPELEKIASVVNGEVAITKEGEKIIDDYNFSYMVNSFFAQKLFIGEHTQAKDNADFIKRATGSIARHDGSLRGVAIEPIVIKDVYINGVNATDAGSFILPEDVPFVQDRVGSKMGRAWKFVYYGNDKRGANSNTHHENNDYYLKTFVQVLDAELIGESKELQAIADKLRARRAKNGYGEALNIATFESSAKKAPGIHGGSKAIDWDADFSEGSEAQKQLNEAYMVGDKLVGIDGSNMGIQLPMDIERNEVNNPTQHHGSNNNDLTEEESSRMDDIVQLEADILNDALDSAIDGVTKDENSTPEARKSTKQKIIDGISKKAVEAHSNGVAKYNTLAHGEMSQNLPGIASFYANAIKQLIRKSSKIITKGGLAIQAVSLGRNLKAFRSGSVNGKKVVLPSEAIVPASYKGKYLARIDQNWKSVSAVKQAIDVRPVLRDRNGNKTKNPKSLFEPTSKGVKIKGLDREFASLSEAQNFLMNRITIDSNKVYIAGETFLGSRIPAHGNQSRVIMEVKGFQKEVKGSNGKHQNNVIQVSEQVNKVLGSDHDGDAIFMNFKYSNPKNGRELKVNDYIDKVAAFYQSPARFEEITASMDYEDGIKARIEKLNSKFKNKEKRQPQNSPMGSAQFFEENVSGGKMIGSIAALNNGMSYLSRYNVELGFEITVDGHGVDKFYNDLDRVGSDSLSFQNAILLNIALDNTKNQHATALGLNPSTVGAASILNRIGVNPEAIDVILNSKAAKLYSKFKGKKAVRDNTYSGIPAAQAAYMMMFGSDSVGRKTAGKWLSSLNDKGASVNTDLISGDPTNALMGEEAEQQKNILALLHKLEDVVKDVYTVNQLVGLHKKAPSNGMESTEMINNINELFEGEKSLKGLGLTALKNNKLINSFVDRLKSLDSIYKANSLTGTGHSRKTFEILKEATNNPSIVRADGSQDSDSVKAYLLNILTNYVPAFKAVQGLNKVTKNGTPYVNRRMEEIFAKAKGIQNSGSNAFLEAISMTEHEGFKGAPAKWTLSPNREVINEYTREFEILEIKKDFARLPLDMQEEFVLLDTYLNEAGMKSTSIQTLFDNSRLTSISKSIDSVHQSILDGSRDIASPESMADLIAGNNPSIVPLGMSIYKDSKGRMNVSDSSGNFSPTANSVRNNGIASKIKVKRFASQWHESMVRQNKPHYIRVQKGDEAVIYKYKPLSHEKFNPKKWRTNHGIYEVISDSSNPNGGGSKIKNIKALDRALTQAAEKQSALISGVNKSMKMKVSSSKSGGEQSFSSRVSPFTFDEYILDKGYSNRILSKDPTLKEQLKELYDGYKQNFNLAQEFDSNIIQTGRISKVSNEKLADYASLLQRLDPSAISGVHQEIVMELARRAAEDQKASRNGIEWTDKGDISWLHAWFGSNNIPGHRPEIQRLIRQMEEEYSKFNEENIKFQSELKRLTKNLIKENLSGGVSLAGKINNFRIWLTGSAKDSEFKTLYGKMYDKTTTTVGGLEVPELKLKSRTEFLKQNPNKAEKEFYDFFVKTTNKYGKISSEALGERWKEGYIPHIQGSLKEAMRQRGLFGLYDHFLQGTGDINHIKVSGYNPATGKKEVKSFHEWKYLYSTHEGHKNRQWYKALLSKSQYRSAAKLDLIRRRAEKLAKSGKHEDGTPVSKTDQEIHGMMGTSLMSRFAKSRGVKASMFGSEDLGRALSQYVNTTMFVYGNENFKGFKKMTPLLDGVIAYNKRKGYDNAVTYLDNVWKKGFFSLGESSLGLGRLTDSAIHKLIKLTRVRFLWAGTAGGFGNLVVGKYNEYRSKGGKVVIRGEKRYWGERNKAWAIIKNQLNPEQFAYDLIQGNDNSGIDSIFMSPYIGSEHYIQGAGLVGQFTDEEWSRIGEDGSIPSDLQDKVDLYVENVTRQHGYGYSRADQIGIATFAWGKAIMQFKKWMPTAVAERFQKETIDRFGVMRSGSNMEAFKFGAEFASKLMAGEESIGNFTKRLKELPEHKREAVKTFFRGMQVVSALTALSMIFGDSDDDEARAFAEWANDSVDDIMFMTDPRRMKRMAEPASWQLIESGATMAKGAATFDRDQFVGGLSGISWTASKVIQRSEKGLSQALES